MSIAAVAKKEIRQLSRDPRSIAVLIVFPALLLLFYGFVITFDVRHVSLAVLDRDRSEESRALVAAMTSAEYFERTHELRADTDLIKALTDGRATVALVIPPGFAAARRRGDNPQLQAIIDGTHSTSAQTAQAYVELFAAAVGVRWVEMDGGSGEAPLTPRVRVLYNPELASEKFLLPGLVAFILMIAACMATALSIVRERETGTMEQLLVSPLSPTAVVLGKALPYGALSCLAAAIVLLMAWSVFGLEIRGSHVLLAGSTVLFVVAAEGLGLLISSVTTSQQVAFQVSTVATILPTMLLSGFIFPIRSMPIVLQAISLAVPARYYVAALRGIVLKGVGLEVVWLDLAALAAFAALVVTLAIGRLRLVRG